MKRGHHHCYVVGDSDRCAICKATPPPPWPLYIGQDEWECPEPGCGYTNHHRLRPRPKLTGKAARIINGLNRREATS